MAHTSIITEPGSHLTALERRATFSLSVIYGVRMLGLFMILPVFALYAGHLRHATPFLMGLAIGAYGLTQALLQVPLGMLSDRVGRKPVIIGGLAVFAAGSVIAAVSGNIYWVIAGRALQGAGAISATIMALAADLSREAQRTKIMAALGFSIGLSFAIALVVGPILQHWIGVPGIFWATAGLAVLATALLVGAVPTPNTLRFQRDTEVVASALGKVLKDRELLRLDLSIFMLHMVNTANFTVIPSQLRDAAHLPVQWHWLLYLLVLLSSFVIMLPFLIYAEKRSRMKPVLLGAILLLAVSEFSLVYSSSLLVTMATSVLLLFVAFNLLESALPSLASKLSSPELRGTSMGVYSTSQFLGVFMGGALGGMLLNMAGPHAVFTGGGVAILLWAALMIGMRNPGRLSNYLLKVGPIDEQRARAMADRLTQVQGVTEAVVVPEDGLAYLKVDRQVLDEGRLREFSTSTA
ncbi:MAG TPA: MFS transporter [Gammaproteobacteria bacterium]|nr:MFS transporter [Gammaproteobacteria bacterium]